MPQYFVSRLGDDANDGSELQPFQTIQRGLKGASPAASSKLKPGDILTIRGGTYVEEVKISQLAGTPGNEITIRSFPGERAVIESRISSDEDWVLAKTVDPQAHDDEWAWNHLLSMEIKPTRGAFLDPPYRRLVSYSTDEDFRADNQTFGKMFFDDPNKLPGPWKVTDATFEPLKEGGKEFTYPWVYMGPGLRVFEVQDPDFPTDPNKKKKQVHVRLSHTNLNLPGLEDYEGSTDPNQVGLAICDAHPNVMAMSIMSSRYLIFSNLTLRFGGENTMLIHGCHCLTFDEVDVYASTGGIRLGALTGATFRNCRFDGGLPPWFFRADKKAEYDCLLTDAGDHFHNSLGKATIDVLLYGEGNNKQDFEIHHCEFVNGHDLYLVAKNMHFHHNWIDNLQDEGMVLDSLPSSSGRIHSNVITRCLSPISLSGDFTAGPWSIYRNLIDLRQPIAGHRPLPEGSPDIGHVKVFRFGNTFKSNEAPKGPDGPHDVFHNTFLVAEQDGQAAYLHYRSVQSPHLRRSFNNIFIAVNSDRPLTFIPVPSFPGPTDGNLYHRFGAHTAPAFRSLGYTFQCVEAEAANYKDLDELQESDLFGQSQAQYPPGYEANSLLTDPRFRKIAVDGSYDPLDDLRLRAQSPARSAGIPLPSDLQALDDAALYADLTTALPIPVPRDIGCYLFGSGPLRVGLHGQRHFPNM